MVGGKEVTGTLHTAGADGKTLWAYCVQAIIPGIQNMFFAAPGPTVACFKMTMGPLNIMTSWHNMLHDITN